MNVLNYEIDFSDFINKVSSQNYHRILLQLPEGLKMRAQEIKTFLEEKTKITVILHADPCFGACDIPCITHLQAMDIDAILQIGHTSIPSLHLSSSFPVFFVNAHSTYEILPIITDALPYLEGKNIGILTTAQHLHALSKVQAFLHTKGFHPVLGKGDERIHDPGQVLGCNFSAAQEISHEVDSFLFIGSGEFHPIGLLLATEKPVIAADPYTATIKKEALKQRKEIILKQRYAAIAKAQESKQFGIIICLKPGQQRWQTAKKIQSIIKKHHRSCLLLTTDTLTPQYLQSFPSVDCYVSTACPRIAIDDAQLYEKPILTPIELEIAFKETSWQKYAFDTVH